MTQLGELSYSPPATDPLTEPICVFGADEIMQLDSSPLCAADIAPDLKRQFAFLSGESTPFTRRPNTVLPL